MKNKTTITALTSFGAGIILVVGMAACLPDTQTWGERVASLNCGPDQVPGWLDAEGLPTSCVNNQPNPGDKGEPPTTQAPAEPATNEECN